MRVLGLLVCALMMLEGCALLAMDPLYLKCEGIQTCGQCTSNPRCGWCSCGCQTAPNPADLTIPSSKCKKPKTWEGRLNHCPLIAVGQNPNHAEVPESTPEERGGVSPVEAQVGSEQHENMRRGLRWAYPHTRSHLPDHVVDGVYSVLDQKHGVRFKGDINTKPLPTRHDDDYESHEVTYYLTWPDHGRSKAPYERFCQPVPMVRFSLPRDGQEIVNTLLGDAYPNDRKFNNLTDAVNRLKPTLGYAPGRVDLLTPLRSADARFAALAMYLGYKKADDKQPTFFVVEAGLATGQPKVLYLAPTVDQGVNTQAAFSGTPFNMPWHWYKAKLEMTDEDPDVPQKLTIRGIRHKGAEAFITVNLHFYKLPRDKRLILSYYALPIVFLAEATARLAAIANALNVPTAMGGFLQGILGDIGKTMMWQVKPHPRATPTPNNPTGGTTCKRLPPGMRPNP